MEIFALVGSSGTGKSHQAMNLAYEHNIDTVIDDGLLIQDGQKIAGSSAKGEPTALKAVKRAIFVDSNHVSEVQLGIESIKPSKILVLGTSKRMVDRIVLTLGLPAIQHYFYIDEVATVNEINTALAMRKNYGMHVIPVPMVEVKDDLAGYLINPLRYFLGKKPGKQKLGEKTIVQPKFSAVGKLTITNQALTQISQFIAAMVPGVARINKVVVEVKTGNAIIYIEMIGKLSADLREAPKRIQTTLHEQIYFLCGINVEKVDVFMRAIK